MDAITFPSIQLRLTIIAQFYCRTIKTKPKSVVLVFEWTQIWASAVTWRQQLHHHFIISKKYQELEVLEKVIHAFISSREDYCNGILSGQQIDRQTTSIHSAAAIVLTWTRRTEHITLALKSLQWLLVSHRMDFKVLLLVYESPNNLGPKYSSAWKIQTQQVRVHTEQAAFSYDAAHW